MKRISVASWLLCLVGLVAAGQVETRSPAGRHPSPRIELPEGADEVSVPFHLVNHHILLPVTVNGSAPLRIVLDTGMPTEGLLLHDTDKTRSLPLAFAADPHVKVGGVGGKGKPVAVRMAEEAAVHIEGLSLLGMQVTLLPPMPGLASYSDGIIGAALFQHFAVTVDNDRDFLIPPRPESYQPPDQATILPLVEVSPTPVIQAKVRMDRPEPFLVKLAVDLGATHAISLNEGDSTGIAAPTRSIATLTGRGISGPVTGRVGRIRTLELGGLALQDVVATFPDKEFLKQPGIGMADGNLGNGALDRFNVTVDYAGKRLVLEPARRFKEPFEWDMSGIVVEVGTDGSVRVREVLSDSPAAKADVRKGDVIVSIAGEPVLGASYFDLREKLQKDGETVPLELRRGKKTMKVSLELRRLV